MHKTHVKVEANRNPWTLPISHINARGNLDLSNAETGHWTSFLETERPVSLPLLGTDNCQQVWHSCTRKARLSLCIYESSILERLTIQDFLMALWRDYAQLILRCCRLGPQHFCFIAQYAYLHMWIFSGSYPYYTAFRCADEWCCHAAQSRMSDDSVSAFDKNAISDLVIPNYWRRLLILGCWLFPQLINSPCWLWQKIQKALILDQIKRLQVMNRISYILFMRHSHLIFSNHISIALSIVLFRLSFIYMEHFEW